MGRTFFLSAVVIPAAFAPAFAQPRSPEVFGQVGLARAAGDEGSLGIGPSFGGALMVPFVPKLGFDLDVQAARTRRDVSAGFELKADQTLVNPAIVYRRGNERAYFFAGGGVGYVSGGEECGATLIGKFGVVAAPGKRFLLRADFLWSQQFVLPHVGVRLGVGYRF